MLHQRNFGSLAAFLVLVIGIGWLIGATNMPGSWYASLAKPSFNPPDWLFPLAWTILNGLIAVAGWRTSTASPRGAAMGLWIAQMLLNFAWSPVMFRFHAIGPALAIIVLMLVMIMGFIREQWRSDQMAAVLFLPYLAWVAFAGLLNLSLYQLNRV